MITLEDAKQHLGETAEKYDDRTIADVLAAEHAHQRTVTHVTGTRPAELDEALLRRVAVNLEQTGGEPLQRVGGRDDTVRALEADHLRRRPAPEPESAPPTNRGHQRRRKKAAKKTASTTPHTKENS